MISGMSFLIVTMNSQCFSAQSLSVEMYAEYEGNKQKGPCIGELTKVHCSVKGSLYLRWIIGRTSLTMIGSPITTLLAVQHERVHYVLQTSTHDLHIYQNKTIYDSIDPENNQIDSEMHIRLDNENDFIEAICISSDITYINSTIKTTKISILGMLKIIIPSSVLLDFIYTRFFVFIISIRSPTKS